MPKKYAWLIGLLLAATAFTLHSFAGSEQEDGYENEEQALAAAERVAQVNASVNKADAVTDDKKRDTTDTTGDSTVTVHKAALAKADNQASKPEDVIRKRLAEAVPGLTILDVRPSLIAGVYEVESNNPQIIYISSDGQYFVAGDIYQVSDGRISNLAEKRRETSRAEMVNAIPDNELVIFSPDRGEVKATITVFTDVDCGYCRKLHLEIPELNRLGVQVNYVAFPRAGVDSHSFEKMVSVWCADDRQQAMTIAKAGKVPDRKTCSNPVSEQFDLARKIGITGTPAIVLADGRLIPGYLPALSLAQGLGIAVASQ